MIKTIVFDLGGVYFVNGTRIAREKIYTLVDAPKSKIDELFKVEPHKEGYLYRKGDLSKDEFWSIVSKKLNTTPTHTAKLRYIFNSSYVPMKGMTALVKKLRRDYRVIAFSVNIQERIDYLNKKYGLNKDFDKFILSHEAGLTKDEIGFYKLMLKNTNAKPNECVFIDDKEKNLIIAKKLGIKTILFKSAKQVESDLRKLGVKTKL